MSLDTATFDFEEPFQKSIIRLMFQSSSFFVSALDIVKPEYFENSALAWFYQCFKNFFIDYGEMPSMEIVAEEIRKAYKAKAIKEVEKDYYIAVFKTLKDPVPASKYIVDQVVDFCRQQAVKKVFMKNVPLINSDDPTKWTRISSEVTEACGVGAYANDLGIQYFKDYKIRINERLSEEFRIITPTGLPKVDHLLNGGLRSGQVGIWMSPTGGGKSCALTFCGKRAIVQGYKVLHYTLELSAEDVAARYDACFSHITMWDLDHKVDELVTSLDAAKSKYDNSLIVKFFPAGYATVATLRAHINQLKSVGWVPDVIIIDYMDLLQCSRRYDQKHEELGQTSIEIVGLAGELDAALWSATQGNRGSVAKSSLDVDDVAAGYSKLMPAAVVLGLKRNKTDKANDTALVTVIKNRNGPDGINLAIDTDYSRMLLYTGDREDDD